MRLNTRAKFATGGAILGAALLGLTAVGGPAPLFAQTPPQPPVQAPLPVPGSTGGVPTHEQMHQMMDLMHGEGFTERMHQAMPGSEQMMEQCVSMMGMMQNMAGMMQGMGGMMGNQGMMGSQGMGGMMGGTTNGMMGGR